MVYIYIRTEGGMQRVAWSGRVWSSAPTTIMGFSAAAAARRAPG